MRINHRDMRRAMTAPHNVTLYKNGQEVGNFTIPRTDTRFVKDDDLLLLAFQAAQSRMGTRYNDLPDWDQLVVYFCGFRKSCDSAGFPIHDA